MNERIKRTLKKIFPQIRILRYAGVIARNPFIIKDYVSYNRKTNGKTKKLSIKNITPFVKDKTDITPFDTHYIYHPAWATRTVKKIAPLKHIDISSTLHFCTQLSSFIPTEFYDYRPAKLNLSNLLSAFADLHNLPFPSDSVESISCMHTVEHVGLGRYGDPIDPEGDTKAINELQRVVRHGGHLLFVTPVGKPRVEFNAHRVYAYDDLIEKFKQMELVEFSLIPDNALETGLIYNADPALVHQQEYGCGCFWFKKK